MTVNRGIFWLLMASMTINLLVIGAIIGLSIANSQKQRHLSHQQSLSPAIVKGFNGARFFRALPEDEKQKARKVFINNKKANRQSVKRVRKLKRQAYFLLRQQNWDQAKLEQVFAELRQAEAEFSKLGQLAVLEILSGLDVNTRIRVVDEMLLPTRKRTRAGRHPQEKPLNNKIGGN